MQETSKQDISSICGDAKRLGTMYLDLARLTAAEKATALFSVLAIAIVGIMLGMVVLVFLTMGIASMLESYIAPFWTFFIVAGVFIAAAILVWLLRDRLVYDPIARFMSKLLLNPPQKP
ncbi:MAG: phage holin family protein [Clostridium sp.]|nr:phage holin family protein [Clostridium sp.]